jgi:hypothetical protein
MGMATHDPNSLELVAPEGRPLWHLVPPAARRWKVLIVALAVALLGVAVAAWPGGLAGERRALLRMRSEERRALYDETRRNADALCTHAQTEDALRDRCVGAASFLRAFPECDEECQAFARAHQRGPTR